MVRHPPASSFCLPPRPAPSSPRSSGATGPWCKQDCPGMPCLSGPVSPPVVPGSGPVPQGGVPGGGDSAGACVGATHTSADPRLTTRWLGPACARARSPAKSRGNTGTRARELPAGSAARPAGASVLAWGRGRQGGLCASQDQNIPFEKQTDVVLGWDQGTPNPRVAGEQG